jgi:nicotinate-nucleotide adenylyltransferase
MRIGIFGGTFDPVHVGHLILAEQAREQGRLDEVWFVPAPRPPQKDGVAITRFEMRVEMLAVATAGHAAFRIDELEKERPGRSYTVETLAELRRRHPAHTFSLLIGGDSLADLPTWRDPQGIAAQAGLLVMARPGSALMSADELRRKLDLPSDSPLSLEVVQAPLIDVSSRDLRRRVAEGRTIRYMVPRGVEAYIHDKGLYRDRQA